MPPRRLKSGRQAPRGSAGPGGGTARMTFSGEGMAAPPSTIVVVLSREASLAPVARKAFRRRGARVFRTSRPAEALHRARAGAHLLLVDLDAPGLPARAFLDRLSRVAPGALPILIAGRKGLAKALAVARERTQEVVAKPIAAPPLRRAANLAAKRREIEAETRTFVDRLAEANRLLSETQSNLRRQILSVNQELLRLQELNASIFRDMGWGLIVLDRAGSVTQINPAALEILDVSEDEALGHAAGQVFCTEEGALLERALIGESPPYDVEVMVGTGGGREVPLLLRTSLLRDADGHAAGLVALFNDLTRLKRQDRDLRRIERLASLGELSAGMAHEIRNPLAGIGTTAELLAKRFAEGDPTRGLLSMIVDEVRRVNRLIEDLLRFARPAAPQFTSQSVHRILDRCVTLLSAKAQAKHLVIERRYGADTPPVDLDQGQMTQVFLNLVKNAIEASAPFGTVTLVTELAEQAAGDGAREGRRHVARVRIIDRGPGIASDNLEKIWNPFFTTKSTGTGLGLPICQRIVTEHRGRISIASEEGSGAEVVVELPVPFYGEQEVPAVEAI